LFSPDTIVLPQHPAARQLDRDRTMTALVVIDHDRQERRLPRWLRFRVSLADRPPPGKERTLGELLPLAA